MSKESRKKYCEEYENYQPFINKIEDHALKQRAEASLKYYIKQAVRYKRLWNILSAAGIVLPALATFFASINSESFNHIVIAITSCTTITTGFLALFKCADKKTSYRNSAENLKSELCAYASQKGIYAVDSADEILFNRLEDIIKEGYQKIAALENNTAEKQTRK